MHPFKKNNNLREKKPYHNPVVVLLPAVAFIDLRVVA